MLKRREKVLIICGVVIVVAIIASLLFNLGGKKTVELMDLYCDIAPYGDLSYGDKYVAGQVFEPLVEIGDNFEPKCVLARKYTVNGASITVDVREREFKTPNGTVKFNGEYMDEYLSNLIRLSDSELLSNPGIANIDSYEVKGSKLTIEFRSEKAENLLALTEYIGYQEDGHWYGTQNLIRYDEKGSVNVGDKVTYVTASSNPGLTNDERITNMMLGAVINNGDCDTERVPNGAYGFITWGPAGIEKFTKETREVIFDALENLDIRKPITLKADSIYDGTSLYTEANINSKATAKALKEAGITVNKSLNIGVVDMGSFSEIDTAITDSLRELEIPVVIDKVSVTDIQSNDDYDLIYVRLERGKSPNFTGLFSTNGILGRLDYTDDYMADILEISEAKTWDEMCELLSKLDNRLRDDGVWKFLDQGYDIKASRR